MLSLSIARIRSSSQCIIAVVTVALLVDHILMSVVVPILPSLLEELGRRRNETSMSPGESTTSYDSTGSIGLLLSCKAIMQLIMNPFVGPITNRMGFNIPLSIGVIAIVVSSLGFAFAQTYILLVVARALHGCGSAFTNVAGCGLIALKFRDEKERSRAMSIALSGIALGDLMGPAFGGFMDEYVNRSSPFLVIAVVALVNGCFQLITVGLTVEKPDEEPRSLKSLLMDPYIIIAAVALAWGNGGIGMLEAALPYWMMNKMGSPVWEQGVAYLPCSFFYIIGAYFCSRVRKIGRWAAIMAGLFLMGISFILLTLCENVYQVLLPTSAIGFGVGLIDTSALPELGRLVDLRHTSVYGNIYVIGDLFPCIGYALTATVSATLVGAIGFNLVMYITGAFVILYAPILWFLKNPSSRKKDDSSSKAVSCAPEGRHSQVTKL